MNIPNVDKKYQNFIILILIFIYHKNIKLYFNIINSCYIKKSLTNYVGLLDNIRVYSSNLNKLHHTPNIILANYSSDRIENFTPLFLRKPISIMMRKELCNLFKLDTIFDVIVTTQKNSFDDVKNIIKDKIINGKYVFCYINKSPYINRHNYGKHHSGMYNIAKELNIPITLVAFDNIDMTWYGSIKDQPFTFTIGPTFYIYPNESINYYKYITKKFFRKNTEKFERIKNFLQ